MGIGWIFLLLGGLWLLQLVLAYQQAQRFMARARKLRRHGKVSIGASPRKVRGRAYVVVAVGPDDRVTAAEALRGVTVFANARPVPALVGRRRPSWRPAHRSRICRLASRPRPRAPRPRCTPSRP